MLAGLLKITWSAFRHGRIFDQPVTRHPIAWIPFFLVLPFVVVAWLLLALGYVLLFPVILLWGYLVSRSLKRRAGVFSDQGIHFPKAYGRLTIAWSDVRMVVRKREPKLAFYRIVWGVEGEPAREHLMTRTPDDKAFERMLQERGIPFKEHDWRRGLT